MIRVQVCTTKIMREINYTNGQERLIKLAEEINGCKKSSRCELLKIEREKERYYKSL